MLTSTSRPSRTVTVAVNARFAARAVTGVERYAAELTARLTRDLGEHCMPLAPRAPATGLRGHLWEQAALPVALRRAGADVLLSLCNVGPVAVTSQLVVIHDVAPYLHPQWFTPAYGRQVRSLQRVLARRCAVATVSQRSRRDIADVLGLDPRDVAVVPPAVGAPFTSDGAGAGGRRCVFVGSHDARKNLAFLLDLWPDVHGRTGLELHVVGRASSATLRARTRTGVAGVVQHVSPTDDELAALYRSAMCVLSPSSYEGFGLPLLEGMACGTPFLATDTGAAAELAVAPGEQLLPLERDIWVERLRAWAGDDLTPLRRTSLAHATAWNWERSSAALLTAAEAARDR